MDEEFGTGMIREPQVQPGPYTKNSRSDPDPVKTEQLIKLKKLEGKAYKSLENAEPALQAMHQIGDVMQNTSVMEIVKDFFMLFYDGLERGLGDAAVRLAEALFTQDNIDVMISLGEATAEVMEVGINPMISGIKELSPYVKDAADSIKYLRDQIDEFGNNLDGLKSSVRDFSEMIKGIPAAIKEQMNINWSRFFDDLAEDLKDAFRDAIKNAIEELV